MMLFIWQGNVCCCYNGCRYKFIYLLRKNMMISSTSPFSHGFYFYCLILFPQFFSSVGCFFSCTDLLASVSLSRSNLLDQTIALDLTKYIIHETDYVPLKTFIQNMLYIGNNLALRKSYGLFKVKM